jgi:hypothetical protein
MYPVMVPGIRHSLHSRITTQKRGGPDDLPLDVISIYFMHHDSEYKFDEASLAIQ